MKQQINSAKNAAKPSERDGARNGLKKQTTSTRKTQHKGEIKIKIANAVSTQKHEVF